MRLATIRSQPYAKDCLTLSRQVKGGKPGQWSARKAQMLAKRYKEAGGGYKD